MEALSSLLYGVLVALSIVIAVFFVRYWRVTRDRFFLFVSVTFVMLAISWGAQPAFASTEHSTYVYVLRLVAFVVLISGIVDKNRKQS